MSYYLSTVLVLAIPLRITAVSRPQCQLLSFIYISLLLYYHHLNFFAGDYFPFTFQNKRSTAYFSLLFSVVNQYVVLCWLLLCLLIFKISGQPPIFHSYFPL